MNKKIIGMIFASALLSACQSPSRPVEINTPSENYKGMEGYNIKFIKQGSVNSVMTTETMINVNVALSENTILPLHLTTTKGYIPQVTIVKSNCANTKSESEVDDTINTTGYSGSISRIGNKINLNLEYIPDGMFEPIHTSFSLLAKNQTVKITSVMSEKYKENHTNTPDKKHKWAHFLGDNADIKDNYAIEISKTTP